MNTVDIVGNFRRSIKNGTLPYILFCDFNFGHLKIAISYMRIHVWVAFKPQYLFVVGAAPFPATQNVIRLSLLCFPNIPSFASIVLSGRMRATRNHCYWPLVHTNSKVGAYCSKSPHQIFRGGYFRCRKMWTVVNGSAVLGIQTRPFWCLHVEATESSRSRTYIKTIPFTGWWY